MITLSEAGGIGARITPADDQGRFLYIITFNEPSLARYEGGFAGLAATSPRATGARRLDVNTAASRAYLSFLESRQAEHLQEMQRFVQRRLAPTHQWKNVLNGVALRLTPDEASLVQGLPFVSAIELDRQDELLSDEGPILIGAHDFWAGLVTGGVGNKGEGVVIGILDTGFNHSHPSFAAVASDGFEHSNPFGTGVFRGVCADPAAEDFEDVCNDKLIGAYSIAAASVTAEDTAASGHGTHVGSTAGGNPVETVILGQTVQISGVAPRANLINYKVCEPLCSAVSRITAVNFALADQVDVLNHSIGNNEPPWASAVSLAFLEANAAGIVVAASAGNSGPGPATAASTGPWNLAVGMSTHGRIFARQVTLDGLAGVPGVAGGGPEITETITANLRWAGDVDSDNILGCNPFPANAFDGEAALIERGGCPFAQKINNATAAGASFALVYNNQGGAPTAMGAIEATTIPSLMVSNVAGAAFIAALGGGTLEVTIGADVTRLVDDNFADIMAAGSSRGPASHNTIAPAVTAPGVSILAASTAANDNFAFLSGTSMSSPHVAGAAALLVAQHPDWSPTEIRSALTLTANPDHRKQDGLTPADPFDMGSGRIDVAAAGNIGFVMDETAANFVAANPAIGGDPSTLNLSSIKTRTCIIECSFDRTIRSVVDEAVEYDVLIDAPPGVTITVTPSSFTLAAGQELDLRIDINVVGAPFDQWLFAALRIEPSNAPTLNVANTRMPVALISREPTPTIVIAPAALSSTQERNDVSEQTFSISNTGVLPLEWSLNELGPQADARAVFADTVIWHNPRVGGSGRINNFSIPANTGIYQSDAFAILAPSTIETIFSEGFVLGTPGVTELVWMVFPDNNGVPAGDPETNPDAAVWSFRAAATAPGVGFVNANMTLDLAAAGAPPLALDPGVYWLIAYPTVQTFSLGPNNLYAWFHGESAGTGRQIGPGGLAGFPRSWAGVPEGRAFTLTGTVDCSAQFNPWTNVSPTSGTVAPGTTESVSVQFFSIGMLEGTYNTAFCVISNDVESPFVLMPVTLNVVNLPAASVDVSSVALEVAFGDLGTGALTLTNTGLGALEFSIFGGARAQGSFGRASELIYDQTASQTTAGALAIFDLDVPETWAVQAADDFTVPPTEAWSIDRVIANGFYGGLVNPAETVRVFIYEDDAGKPGNALASFMDLTPGNDAAGILSFDLPTTVSLPAGTYWISVQPEMDFFGDGRWFWSMNAEQVGNPFHWRNPGNGYGTGCTDWTPGPGCGFGHPDLSFQLFGSIDNICQPLSAIPWLDVDPVSGTVAPEGGQLTLSLIANAAAAIPGEYAATICIDTNDGVNPRIPVEVLLTVTGEAPDVIFGDRFEGQGEG